LPERQHNRAIEDVKSITPAQLEKVFQDTPALSDTYKIVRRFKEILL
jgi:hypothetical protein